MKLHAHCAGDGEFIGREQGFKDSANNPACSDRALNKGYVHALALSAGRLLGRARRSKGQHHLGRCGCCAAHTTMAHDMARSSWCPTGHL